MKKAVLLIGIVLVVLSLSLTVASCGKSDFPTRIEVTVPPDSTSVTQGGEIDFTGCVLTIFYEDGTEEVVSPDEIEVKDFDADAVGKKQAVELVYSRDDRKISTILSVTVVEPKVISLEWEGDFPTEYMEGEYLEKDSLTVCVNYENGTKKETRNFTLLPSGKLTSDVTKAVISYQGVKTEIPVTVKKKAIESLTVLYDETAKKSYIEGDEFSAEGISVKVRYNDKTEETFLSDALLFTHFDDTPYERLLNAEDLPYVTVETKWGIEKKAITDLTIIPIQPESIEATVIGGTLVFVEGDFFSFKQEVKVTVHYNNGNVVEYSTKESAGRFSYEMTMLASGQTTQEFWLGSYDEVKGTVDITVLAPNLTGITMGRFPTKWLYAEGEAFDPTGMTILLHFDNYTEKEIDWDGEGVSVSDFIVDDAGRDPYVVIEYGGFFVEWDDFELALS